MSVDVTITQKGLLKKELPLNIILGENLEYGYFNGISLKVGEMDETEFMVYNPEAIGRGFSVEWTPKEKKSVALRMLTPTCREELRDFSDCIGRISDFWQCTLELDGEPLSIEGCIERIKEMEQFNLDVLHKMTSDIVSGEHDTLTLFSAMWPISLGAKEAAEFVDCETLEPFGKFLHEKQSIDAYYANPRVYQNEEGFLGVYTLSEDVRSIFPLKPTVPFGMTDPESEEALKVDNWELVLYSFTKSDVLGTVPYEAAIKKLPKEKVSYYDASCILIENLTLSEMETLID